MGIKELIHNEIEQVPEQHLPELLDFVRSMKGMDRTFSQVTLLASETVLKKDWLRPQEDKAWKDL